MNCHDFRRELSASVESQDGALEKWRRLEQHACACSEAGCRKSWADHQLLSAVIPVWKKSIPQASLSVRVVSELRREHPAASHTQPLPRSREAAPTPASSWTSPSGRPAQRWVGFAAAVASLVLIVALIGVGDRPAMEIATWERPHSEQAERIGSPGVNLAEPNARRDEIPDVIRTYVSVPQTATEFVTDTVVMFLPGDVSDPGDELPSRPAQWRGRLSEQLEPWGRELGTAFDAILESMKDAPSSSQRGSPQQIDRSQTA